MENRIDVDPLALAALLAAAMTEVRVYLVASGSYEKIEHYKSGAVPRIGDNVCVQHWSAEVVRVEWTIINGVAFADVFCEMDEAEVSR